MFRIDVPSAVPALPAPAAPGVPGFFSGGDPVGGTDATVVAADFLNMVQEELLAIVVAGGDAPSKTVYTQVRDALAALYGITGNLVADGHVSIPVGAQAFTINWGAGVTADGSGTTHVVFDRAYSTTILFAMAGNRGAGIPTVFHNVGNFSDAGMDVHSATSAGAPAAAGASFGWLTFGI